MNREHPDTGSRRSQEPDVNENSMMESALNKVQDMRTKANFVFDTTNDEDSRPDIH